MSDILQKIVEVKHPKIPLATLHAGAESRVQVRLPWLLARRKS
jgi:hypothetical protein